MDKTFKVYDAEVDTDSGKVVVPNKWSLDIGQVLALPFFVSDNHVFLKHEIPGGNTSMYRMGLSTWYRCCKWFSNRSDLLDNCPTDIAVAELLFESLLFNFAPGTISMEFGISKQEQLALLPYLAARFKEVSKISRKKDYEYWVDEKRADICTSDYGECYFTTPGSPTVTIPQYEYIRMSASDWKVECLEYDTGDLVSISKDLFIQHIVPEALRLWRPTQKELNLLGVSDVSGEYKVATVVELDHLTSDLCVVERVCEGEPWTISSGACHMQRLHLGHTDRITLRKELNNGDTYITIRRQSGEIIVLHVSSLVDVDVVDKILTENGVTEMKLRRYDHDRI